MIKMIFEGIYNNSKKIDNIANYIDKMNAKYLIAFGVLLLNDYIVFKSIKNEIKEMKSKGE